MSMVSLHRVRVGCVHSTGGESGGGEVERLFAGQVVLLGMSRVRTFATCLFAVFDTSLGETVTVGFAKW